MFQQLRKTRRNNNIKRNRRVIYDGQLMRIASISPTGGLVLRKQTIVHPSDSGLVYEATEDHRRALNLLYNGLIRMSPEFPAHDEKYVSDYELAMKIFREMQQAYEQLHHE